MKSRVIIMVLLGVSFCYGTVFASDIAVIVHPKNPLKDISQKTLRKIFLYEKLFWDDGSRIYILMRESGSEEKKIFTDEVFGMNDEDLKRLWLSKLYQGEIPSPPKIVHSDQSMKLFVSRVSTSIGFIDSKETDNTVKILRIEGKLPGEENYLLRAK